MGIRFLIKFESKNTDKKRQIHQIKPTNEIHQRKDRKQTTQIIWARMYIEWNSMITKRVCLRRMAEKNEKRIQRIR